jgi:predicted  nucleic acid-binding Zn-ribbon protein
MTTETTMSPAEQQIAAIEAELQTIRDQMQPLRDEFDKLRTAARQGDRKAAEKAEALDEAMTTLSARSFALAQQRTQLLQRCVLWYQWPKRRML